MKNDETTLYNITTLLHGVRYALFDLATWKNGLAFKKIDFSESGVPIIKIAELNNGIGTNTSYTQGNYGKDVYLQKGDILFSWSGNPETSIDVYRCRFTEGWLNQHIFKVTADEKKVCKDFLYYLLKYLKPNFTKIAINKQTTGLGHVTVADLKKLSVVIPDKNIQYKIAAILSALDDKIELNNKINENLEQQAQAIFKSWFVDFEPFGGVMPQDWKVGKLSEILKLKKRTIQPNEDKSLPYLPIDLIPIKSLAIKEVRPNEEALSSLLRFDENDILIGAMRVYFHRVAIAPFNGITRTTCFILESINPKYFAYGVITCNQNLTIDYAQKTSKGSTMPYAVWEGGLGEFEIPIPNEKIADKFNKIMKPLFEQIKNSFFENKYLQEIRDALLPKLMNGEIDVSEVKI